MQPLEQIIGAEGLSLSADGVRLEMRLPWYRSLPLSTVHVEDCRIDDVSVLDGDARILLEERSYTLAEARDATDIFWFVLDPACLWLPKVVPAAGSTIDVSLTLVLYPPYIAGMRREITEARQFAV